MKITLFDKNPLLCRCWTEAFEGCPDISISETSLEGLPAHDCLVTAGNSFGAMSGGIDLAVRNLLGYAVQDHIQLEIMRLFPYGMPVGDVLACNFEQCGRFNKLIYAPTMRTPSRARLLDITYVVMVVLFTATVSGVESIAIPGLGTGCGEVPEEHAARAMRAGYDAAGYLGFGAEATCT
jgi:O-acetyl-ADP-ribose deacetylase (regulator of RNase III)